MSTPPQPKDPGSPPSTWYWHRTTTYRLLQWFTSWRILRINLLILACLITLVTLFYVVENWRGHRAWTRYNDTLKAQGETLDITALVPKPVSDDQNLAMAPLFKCLFSYTRSPEETRWTDSNAMARLEGVQLRLRGNGETNKLTIGSLQHNTFTDLDACRLFYRGNTNYPQPTASGKAAEDILIALSKFDDVFQELQKESANRPFCRFPVDYEQQPPIAILLPHLSKMKGLASVLQLKAIAHLDLGHPEAAWQALQLNLILAEALRKEPILISYLVSAAMLNSNLQVLREGLARHAWTDSDLQKLEQQLSRINLLAAYKHAIRGERAMITGTLDFLRQADRDSVMSLMSYDDAAFATLTSWIPGGWIQQNMVTIARWHQDHTLASVDANIQRVFPEKTAHSGKETEPSLTSPYKLLAAVLYPAISSATRRAAQYQTYIDAARLACALERYRLAESKWPDNLDALLPRFLDKLPHDVMTGQPLNYETNNQGDYLISSVGWNQKPDPNKNKWSLRKMPRENGQSDWEDWTWLMPAALNPSERQP